MVIIVKTKKNPRMNAVVCENFFFRMECPTIIGIRGNTQGEITDAAPVKKEIKKLIFILCSIKANLTIDRLIRILPAFLFPGHLNLE